MRISDWSSDVCSSDLAWSYEDPIEDGLGIRGYIAFYWNKVEAWFEDEQPVEINADDAAVERANPLAGWLLREAWEATSSAALVDRFARQLVEAGFGASRVPVILPTLHPQDRDERLVGHECVSTGRYRWS